MKRWLIIIGILGFVTAIGVVFAYLLSSGEAEETQNRRHPETLPSETTTFTATLSPTVTFTPSPSATATITPSPTTTATLATRVAVATLIMPDVSLPASPTPRPENLQILAEAPEPVEPLSNATLLPFPYTDFTDWVAFESDHPAIRGAPRINVS